MDEREFRPDRPVIEDLLPRSDGELLERRESPVVLAKEALCR
jgi:hypothetical protein